MSQLQKELGVTNFRRQITLLLCKNMNLSIFFFPEIKKDLHFCKG